MTQPTDLVSPGETLVVEEVPEPLHANDAEPAAGKFLLQRRGRLPGWALLLTRHRKGPQRRKKRHAHLQREALSADRQRGPLFAEAPGKGRRLPDVKLNAASSLSKCCSVKQRRGREARRCAFMPHVQPVRYDSPLERLPAQSRMLPVEQGARCGDGSPGEGLPILV